MEACVDDEDTSDSVEGSHEEVEVVSGEGGEGSEARLLPQVDTCDDHLVEEAADTFHVHVA